MVIVAKWNTKVQNRNNKIFVLHLFFFLKLMRNLLFNLLSCCDMNARTLILVAFLACLFLLMGCTAPQVGAPSGGAAPSASSGGESGVSAAQNLVPTATDVVPDYNMVKIDVGEKDYLGSIPVIFQGGMGQIHVTKIDVTLYRADGEVVSKSLGMNKGDEVDLQGTKQTDRVVVYVTFDNGSRLKTNDALSAYRTRG